MLEYVKYSEEEEEEDWEEEWEEEEEDYCSRSLPKLLNYNFHYLIHVD